jgi:hypothetical protein
MVSAAKLNLGNKPPQGLLRNDGTLRYGLTTPGPDDGEPAQIRKGKPLTKAGAL